MSIGKNSIARAVNANANAIKTQNTVNENVITNFLIENIGVLSSTKSPDDIEIIKSNIKKRGVLCPVLVAATPKGDVWLIDGYRRYFAAKELKISQLSATVINVENKSEANRIYSEFLKLKNTEKVDNIHQEKFRVLAVKDHDLPTYLL